MIIVSLQRHASGFDDGAPAGDLLGHEAGRRVGVGLRPIADTADESVLYGIEMNVIGVPLQVGIVPDRMLPNSAAATSLARA
jgi:hypothetical protein